MEEYEVSGDFTILFPLEEHKDTYEEINFLQDVIRNALEFGHIKVMRINVRIVEEPNKNRGN